MTKILIIEDHNDLREDIIEMLELEGYQAFGAEDGAQGIDVARMKMPDLIVCDIMMPGMNGYEVLETLRAYSDTATIPVIFLTARAEKVSRRQGMVLGADDYLTKPMMVNELLDSIKTQLRKRQELNEIANKHLEALRQNIATALPHEFRTPLNTIIGFSEMLKTEAQRLKPDQVIGWSEHINSAAKRLHRLVENYLYYIRLQVAHQSKTLPEVEEADLAHDATYILEEEILRLVSDYKRYNDVTMEFEFVQTLGIPSADLSKVVKELVENALKFSHVDTPIHVSGRIVEDNYQLSIVDKGIGISDEQREEIGAYMQFERFINEQQGLGLGLAIVDLLAKVHQIEFSINGKEGEGTTVCLTIPIFKAP